MLIISSSLDQQIRAATTSSELELTVVCQQGIRRALLSVCPQPASSVTDKLY